MTNVPSTEIEEDEIICNCFQITESNIRSHIVKNAATEVKDVTLDPTQAYGERKDEAVMPVNRKNFPEDFKVEVGGMVQGQTEQGMPIQATIVGEDEENLILDMNHPLAGKSLNFNIELVEIGE